jgi:hypothetical protein
MKRALHILTGSLGETPTDEIGLTPASSRLRALARARLALARMPRRRVVQCDVRRVRRSGSEGRIEAALRRYVESCADPAHPDRPVRLSLQA